MRCRTVSSVILVFLLMPLLQPTPARASDPIKVRIINMPRNHNVTKSMVCPPGVLPCDNDCTWNLSFSAVADAPMGISSGMGRVDYEEEPHTWDPPLSSCSGTPTNRSTITITRDFAVNCPGTHNGVNEADFFIDFDVYGCGPPTNPGYGTEFLRLKLKCYYCSNDKFVAVDGNGTTEVGWADHEQNVIIQYSVLNLRDTEQTCSLIPSQSIPCPYYPAFPASIVLGPGESQEFLVTVQLPPGLPPGAENIFTLVAEGEDGLWISADDTILVNDYTDTDEDLSTPSAFDLQQNYPNPFNPATEITYDLMRDCRVRLDIIDVTGRRVVTLVDERQTIGRKSVHWDGRNSNGSVMPSGTYFCRLDACGYSETKKVILLR
jgi:hypothetical protein